jgi:hypothetical protein
VRGSVERLDPERENKNRGDSMTENGSSTPQPRQSRYQFGLASLCLLTLLVACILSAYRCLGPVYGWISAIPLGIIAILLLYAGWQCTIGTLIGGVVLSLVGIRWIIGFDVSDIRFFKAMVTLGSYGGAFGASIHAIIRKRWIVGSVLLAVAIIVLVVVLIIPISPG